MSVGVDVPIDLLAERDQQTVIQRCQGESCQQAKDSLLLARNEAARVCQELQQAKGIAEGAAATAALLAGVAAAAVAAAAKTSLFPPVAAGLLVVAKLAVAAAVGALIVFAAALISVAVWQGRFAEARDAARDIILQVMRACPQQCRPDLSLPSCS